MFKFKSHLAFLLAMLILTIGFAPLAQEVKGEEYLGEEIFVDVDNKSTIEIELNEFDEIDIYFYSPDNEIVIVDAVYDENGEFYLFEINPDIPGQWRLFGYGIDGEMTEIDEIYFNAVYPKAGKIYADKLENLTFADTEDYIDGITDIYALDNDGEYLEININITGAINQSFTYFSDDIEIYTDEIIETAGEGDIQISLSAEGLNDLNFSFYFSGDKEINLADYRNRSEFIGNNNENIMAFSNMTNSHPVEQLSYETNSGGIQMCTLSSDYSGSGSQIIRLSGQNKYETAAEISSATTSGTNTAILVNGDSFADALVASSITREYSAPILYVNNKDIPQASLNELKRLGVEKVYIIGGFNIINSSVDKELKAQSYNVQRLYGENRYETAIEVNKELRKNNKGSTAILVNSSAAADALIAGPYASKNRIPVFYTSKNSTDQETLSELKDYQKVIIVGSSTVVDDCIVSNLRNIGLSVERIGGKNRYETSVKFAEKYLKDSDRVILAGGNERNFVDSLAASFLGGVKSAPILLTNSDQLSKEAKEYYNNKDVDISYVLGGTTAISNNVCNQIPSNSTNSNNNVSENIRIMLDPGHGVDYNIGANSSYYEGNMTIYLAHYLKAELEKYCGVEVGITRQSGGNTSPSAILEYERSYAKNNGLNSINNQIYSLTDRGRSAKDCDLLLSLHSNATSSSDVKGSEVFDCVSVPNKDLAENLIKAISNTFGHMNRGVKYRYNDSDAEKENWYGVLRDSAAENSMLIEHGFHTNPDDVNKLMDQDFLKKLAKAEAEVIANYYGLIRK